MPTKNLTNPIKRRGENKEEKLKPFLFIVVDENLGVVLEETY